MAGRTNPLVKLAMTAAGIGAGILGKKVLEIIWESTFNEDIPDDAQLKKADKDLKKRQKQAKKEGWSNEDIATLTSDFDDVPAWRIALWTILSGTVIVGLQQLAREGTREGAEKLVARRPRPNRG